METHICLPSTQLDYAPPDLNENDWKPKLDNDYASEMFTAIEQTEASQRSSWCSPSDLCETCKACVLNLWNYDFEMTYDASELKASANSGACKLCDLLWHTYSLYYNGSQKIVRVERQGHLLKMSNVKNPVLTIVRHPGDHDGSFSTDYQIGMVDLPPAHGPTHLRMLQHWLKECDHQHKLGSSKERINCKNTQNVRLPTRVLEVGSADSLFVYLRQNIAVDTEDWVALSHQWGKGKYCTTRKNLDAHLAGIKVDDLANTFKDAVIVTRALGKKYLWIDSLCIVQGVDGDFREQADKMEDVYSGAYCVIAASRATDHYAGFLKPRKPRKCLGFTQDGQPPFFICQNIDNFKRHVLDGGLNSRGWVLQEHALARRTLFFTDYQTYFECGGGVRCETSTKLWKYVLSLIFEATIPY